MCSRYNLTNNATNFNLLLWSARRSSASPLCLSGFDSDCDCRCGKVCCARLAPWLTPYACGNPQDNGAFLVLVAWKWDCLIQLHEYDSRRDDLPAFERVTVYGVSWLSWLSSLFPGGSFPGWDGDILVGTPRVPNRLIMVLMSIDLEDIFWLTITVIFKIIYT